MREYDRLAMHSSITEKTCLKDIRSHGASTGPSGFCYHSECSAWYTENQSTVSDYIVQSEETTEAYFYTLNELAQAGMIFNVTTAMVYTFLDLYAAEYADECDCDECNDMDEDEDEDEDEEE